jgi:hypothetical protein
VFFKEKFKSVLFLDTARAQTHLVLQACDLMAKNFATLLLEEENHFEIQNRNMSVSNVSWNYRIISCSNIL